MNALAPYYASLAAGILLGVAGQIVLKSGAEGAATIVAQFLNPVTLLGLAIYFAAALLYIMALKKIPLVIAFPSVSISYVAVAILAHLLWKEPFGWQQMVGIALICSGVVLLNQY